MTFSQLETESVIPTLLYTSRLELEKGSPFGGAIIGGTPLARVLICGSFNDKTSIKVLLKEGAKGI